MHVWYITLLCVRVDMCVFMCVCVCVLVLFRVGVGVGGVNQCPDNKYTNTNTHTHTHAWVRPIIITGYAEKIVVKLLPPFAPNGRPGGESVHKKYRRHMRVHGVCSE